MGGDVVAHGTRRRAQDSTGLVESGVAATLSEGEEGKSEKKANSNSLDGPPVSPLGDSV